ncbi:MAG: bacillithiol system redox-active protein YtxJ [Polaribacter sp.]|jgi:bacillithiol system protein YtxJ|uniref:bacillithiol system redox-active protein YtxJ n=1 Tax=uncultured Polaribacter sp. TaxID=174711 RepID=UPI0030DC1C58
MGIFNNMFGGKEGQEEKPEKKTYLTWLPLTSSEQLETIKTESNTASVLIFKDSTRCGISKMVIKQFEKLFTEENQHLKVYYLDLLNYRDISNEIAVKFQVMHQSPQLIVVRNGSAVHHASHNDITQVNLTRFI